MISGQSVGVVAKVLLRQRLHHSQQEKMHAQSFPVRTSITNSMHIHIPSDTKLLLTKDYSEIFIFEKLRISRVISGKKSFFPGDFEGANSLQELRKIILGELFSVIISVSEGT